MITPAVKEATVPAVISPVTLLPILKTVFGAIIPVTHSVYELSQMQFSDGTLIEFSDGALLEW